MTKNLGPVLDEYVCNKKIDPILALIVVFFFNQFCKVSY